MGSRGSSDLCGNLLYLSDFINGIVISYLQVPAFIGTLGMQLIVYGVCLVYTNATPIGGYHSAYTAVAKGKLFGVIPYPVPDRPCSWSCYVVHL